jgi:hypothetical protein
LFKRPSTLLSQSPFHDYEVRPAGENSENENKFRHSVHGHLCIRRHRHSPNHVEALQEFAGNEQSNLI